MSCSGETILWPRQMLATPAPFPRCANSQNRRFLLPLCYHSIPIVLQIKWGLSWAECVVFQDEAGKSPVCSLGVKLYVDFPDVPFWVSSSKRVMYWASFWYLCFWYLCFSIVLILVNLTQFFLMWCKHWDWMPLRKGEYLYNLVICMSFVLAYIFRTEIFCQVVIPVFFFRQYKISMSHYLQQLCFCYSIFMVSSWVIYYVLT